MSNPIRLTIRRVDAAESVITILNNVIFTQYLSMVNSLQRTVSDLKVTIHEELVWFFVDVL